MTDIGIPPGFEGVAVHDGYQRYWDFDQIGAHQSRGARLLRNLASVAEVASQAGWAGAMAGRLREANRACHRARDAGRDGLDEATVHAIRTRYGRLVSLGYKANPPPQHRRRDSLERESYNLVRRLDRYRKDVLRFCDDLAVPFTNNEGERDVRPIKIHQKVSYLWRTLPQAQAWRRIRSCISTLRKNDQPVLDQIRNAVTGAPRLPSEAW
jgi:transposase